MRRKEKKPGLFSGRNLVALFIVATMVFSVLGYMFGRNEAEDTFEYNGYTFNRIQNQWKVKVGQYKLTFFSDPRFIDHLNLSSEAVNMLKNSKMTYVTYNISGIIREDVALAHYTIADQVWDSLQIYLAQASTDENDLGLPVITCENATPSVPVIYFKYSNSTGFTWRNGCLISEVRSRNEVYSLTDRLLYGLYGIIQ